MFIINSLKKANWIKYITTLYLSLNLRERKPYETRTQMQLCISGFRKLVPVNTEIDRCRGRRPFRAHNGVR